MRAVVAKLYQRVSHFTLALILAVSTVTAVAPFILSQKAQAAGVVHTTDLSTWDLSETRATGHNNLVADGLHVWTEGATSTDKAAGYIQTPGLSLADVDSTAINFASYTGGRPSVQLVVDRDNNSTPDGILVYEPWAYPPGDTYWTNGLGFGVPAGMGYASNGTLSEYQAANPNAKILAIGYSLGSGVLGDAVISSIEIGDTTYTFGLLVDNQRPQLSNISITPTINGNIGGVVTVYFDLEDATGVDLTKTRVLFADGPNTANASKESAKFTPVHISGNSYKVEINTLDFVKANWTGQYNLTFNLWDVLGNQGSSKPADFRNILIDNSGPTSTLISPTSGSIINGTQRFVFDVSDHTGVASGYMKFQEGSTQYPLINGGSGEWYTDINTSLLSDGEYTIDARFVDSFGKARYGANKGTVTIDSLAPHVEITNPVGNLFNTDVEVRGTVNDLHPRHYWIHVTRNGVTVLNNTILASSFTNQLLYTATQEGDYVVTLAARDAAGGTATSGNRSLDVTKSFTIDKTVLAPTLVSPADGAVVKGASVTQEWSTTDSDIDYYIYESYNDALATSLRWHEQFSSTSKTATNVAEAEYWWRVKAVDHAGNVSDWSDLWKITIDNTAPAVPVNLAWTPTSGTALAAGGATNISGGVASWDASDSDTVQYIYRYWNNIDGNPYKAGSPWTTTSGSNSLPGSFTEGEGTHYFSVAAVDAAGNQSDFSEPFVVTYDATAPSVTIDALVTTDTTPTLTGTVDADAVEVIVTIDGVDYPAVLNSDGTWSLELTTPLSIGSYPAVVTAKDDASNEGTANATITVEQVVVEENNPDTTDDDETAPQFTVTPQIAANDPDVLGDQTENEDEAVNEDQDVAAAQDENNNSSDNESTAGLAWYWWLVIIAAAAGLGWWIIAALRRRSAEN